MTIVYLGFYLHPYSILFTFPTLLPGGQNLCKITQKGPLKVTFGPGKLVALRPPILTKSGKVGAGKYFLILLSFFRSSLANRSFFGVLNLGWIKNISFSEHVKMLNWLCRKFSVFCRIISEIGRERRNLGETWQQCFPSRRILSMEE